MPLLENKKDFSKVAIISMISSAFFLVFIVSALLLCFPFISNSEELLSTYLLVRNVEFGTFFQRTDAFFILLWILSSLSYLSITLMLILNAFSKATNISNQRMLAPCFGSIIFAIALLLNHQQILSILDAKIYKYFILILVFGISTLILLLANLKKIIKSKNKLNIKEIFFHIYNNIIFNNSCYEFL